MATNYADITKADQKNVQGGYQNKFYFARKEDFDAIAKPATPSALGDKVTISTDHTFKSGKGWYAWLLKLQPNTIAGEGVGDPGVKAIKWTASVFILGDSASTQEQIQEILNDDIICLMRDQSCDEETYIQLGDECVSPEITPTFTGNTTAEGNKEYQLDIAVRQKKYFYTGTVTLASEAGTT